LGTVIAIISGKGGVGKTTTTANLGLGIAQQGKRCIIVDFDIGQRNLDMVVGLENRVVYDMVQVMECECSAKQAIIKSKVNENLHFLAASQTKDKSILDSKKVEKLLDELKESYEFVLLDAPAGIESGFEHTIEFTDQAIIVVNPEVSSIRDADRAIGILDAKSQKVKRGEEVEKLLIINRISAEMVQRGEMLRSHDILDILDIALLGKIPEDKGVIDASNQGKPVILDKKSQAGQAYTRISKRLCGGNVPLADIENYQSGVLTKLAGMFK